MRRFKEYVAVTAGLVLLAATCTLLSSRQATAENSKIQSVQVVSPLPLPVNANITSPVSANIVGPVSANIVGAVPLTAFTVPLAPAEPFQQVVFVTIENGTTGNLDSFDVPNGKRLVIEHVGGEIFLPAGQFARFSQIRTDFSGAGFPLIANKVADQSDNVYLINAPMKLYADQNVEFSVGRAPASLGSALCVFTVSGYLVNR